MEILTFIGLGILMSKMFDSSESNITNDDYENENHNSSYSRGNSCDSYGRNNFFEDEMDDWNSDW